MKKILLLGSNGFIGRNLEEHFSQKSEYSVLAPKRAELNLLDDQACFAYLKSVKPDKIIYSAVTLTSLEDTVRMFFNIFRHKNQYGFLYNLGSGAEYDKLNYKPLMKEDLFGHSIPADSYGLGKYMISREIEAAKGNAANFRIFAIYGKHEDYNRRFISNNICRVLAGKTISLNRNIAFDFIHVDDLCRLLDKVLEKNLSYFNYNLCSSQPVELLELAELLARKMNVGHAIKPIQDGMGKEYSGDNGLLMGEIGSDYKFKSFHQGIDELLIWYQNLYKQKLLSLDFI